MATDKIKVAVRVRPFNRRGIGWLENFISRRCLHSGIRGVFKEQENVSSARCLSWSVSGQSENTDGVTSLFTVFTGHSYHESDGRRVIAGDSLVGGN